MPTPEALNNLAQRFSAGVNEAGRQSPRGMTDVTFVFQQSHPRHLQHQGSVPSISEELQPKLWAYMASIAKKQGFQAIVIGGIRDHVYVLLLLPPAMPLAKAVQYLEGSSSKWPHENGADFSWQEGYGAFSVSASQTEDVVRYINNQAAHHAERSFEDEFQDFLRRYDVAYDPKYVLG